MTFCQGGCNQEILEPTTEKCCRCIEPEAACNEITTEDLQPGYKCNEVDYDDEDGSCNIGGSPRAFKEEDDKSVATVIIDFLGLRAVEPGDQVFAMHDIFTLKFTLGHYQCKEQGKKLCCQPLPYGVLSDELRRNGERDQ